MSKTISSVHVNVEELKNDIDTFLSKVADGETVLIEDENNKTLSYLVEPKYYELAMRNKAEIIEKYILIGNKLKEIKKIKSNELLSVNELTKAQQSLLKIKNKLPFFDDCNDMELISVIDEVRILKLDSEEKIFLENETSKNIYYIINGSVEIIKRVGEYKRAKKIATIQQKEFFGEMSFITNHPRTASAQASKNIPTTLISFKIKENVDSTQEYILKRIYQSFSKSLSKKLETLTY